jgi:hypothetical protein
MINNTYIVYDNQLFFHSILFPSILFHNIGLCQYFIDFKGSVTAQELNLSEKGEILEASNQAVLQLVNLIEYFTLSKVIGGLFLKH